MGLHWLLICTCQMCIRDRSHTGWGKVEPIRGYIAQRKTDNYIMKSKDAVFLIKTPGNPVKGKNNVFPWAGEKCTSYFLMTYRIRTHPHVQGYQAADMTAFCSLAGF